MSNSYTLFEGSVPLLISMPHNGEEIPADIAAIMTAKGREVADTDWYMDRLYAFAKELGAYILIPKYNRYVIDLNRDPDGVDLYPGANNTELCPTTAFDLLPLYQEGCAPTTEQITERVKNYWLPYHQALASTMQAIKTEFGQAVLLEAHSIRSHVPRFFQGQLPDFNFGNADGKSCAPELIATLADLDYAPYTMVCNGRFKGGYITRAFGQPSNNFHAVQLELSQHTYMNEQAMTYNETLALQVQPKLQALVKTLITFASTTTTSKNATD
ncbi:N-formylglutamate deformylase [Colwellia sp. BRX10-3]|uniref:N-formylglutamate deformylase n=1 Tax=Colwellia sp. BRX10-3 TaxID=2759844 RepID=UPI0015F45182|nr:N-formylglutamate deformylase [Colwellia sp. BRX10-3]MBA6389901.1 N-formylglutamate deformylase [Colwellia sp. BRX10-3]